MKIAVIAAMNKELNQLLATLEKSEIVEIGPRIFYLTKYQKHDLILTVAGIGKVNASITTTLILSTFNPDLVINIGIAGGIEKSLKTLDVVIANKVSFHDIESGFLNDSLLPGQLQGEPKYYPCDTTILDYIKADKSLKIKCHKGLIITGDQFVTDRSYVDNMMDAKFKKDKVYACDMESASIAQVCYQFKKPVIIVRSISDIIGVDQEHEYPNFIQQAVDNATKLVMLVLNNY